jgi:hypothetical protein
MPRCQIVLETGIHLLDSSPAREHTGPVVHGNQRLTLNVVMTTTFDPGHRREHAMTRQDPRGENWDFVA